MTTQNQEDADRKGPDVRAVDILDPNNQIGNRLRSFYAAVQDEAIPDRLLDLLEKLDQAERLASAKVSD
ncbi:NepR family anti-sigma factor [Rhizobium sp. CB3090]|uniref:NepR family anti-sigma factor n=1 Tax=Rhizobium sp. CB3090 TaxID=3039156 RepID=UPI0024B0EA05|nr:NepR family anti-sigma factor [Rhizobium sp. CB3090]WFU07945.1 NepR family anti-sigma factor [Rhizobium sp. CB3090]